MTDAGNLNEISQNNVLQLYVKSEAPLTEGQIIDGPEGNLIVLRMEGSNELYAVPCTTDENGAITLNDNDYNLLDNLSSLNNFESLELTAADRNENQLVDSMLTESNYLNRSTDYEELLQFEIKSNQTILQQNETTEHMDFDYMSLTNSTNNYNDSGIVEEAANQASPNCEIIPNPLNNSNVLQCFVDQDNNFIQLPSSSQDNLSIVEDDTSPIYFNFDFGVSQLSNNQNSFQTNTDTGHYYEDTINSSSLNEEKNYSKDNINAPEHLAFHEFQQQEQSSKNKVMKTPLKIDEYNSKSSSRNEYKSKRQLSMQNINRWITSDGIIIYALEGVDSSNKCIIKKPLQTILSNKINETVKCTNAKSIINLEDAFRIIENSTIKIPKITGQKKRERKQALHNLDIGDIEILPADINSNKCKRSKFDNNYLSQDNDWISEIDLVELNNVKKIKKENVSAKGKNKFDKNSKIMLMKSSKCDTERNIKTDQTVQKIIPKIFDTPILSNSSSDSDDTAYNNSLSKDKQISIKCANCGKLFITPRSLFIHKKRCQVSHTESTEMISKKDENKNNNKISSPKITKIEINTRRSSRNKNSMITSVPMANNNNNIEDIVNVSKKDNEKPVTYFCCDICNKLFSHQINLMAHQKIHQKLIDDAKKLI